jgi:myo-inositol-1(or 4)-monophosphatase
MSIPKPLPLAPALQRATEAVHLAGNLMRRNHRAVKKINESTQHDLKLELDVRCQTAIERHLLNHYPDIPILGEEGARGNPDAPYRWIVDPIDGTVNFAYGIPHCCSIVALQARSPNPHGAHPAFETVLGAIYDPFCNELWTARQSKPARLNNRPIHVSQKTKLRESMVSVGFAKQSSTLQRMLPTMNHLLPRVRKIRMMGSAGLALAYVACGRLDAYLEYGLRLWDVAAGGLILVRAGGDFWNRPLPGPLTYQIIASNGRLSRSLAQYR